MKNLHIFGPVILIVAGLISFLAFHFSGSYVDSDGLLIEQFYLIPIGYLLLVTGVAWGGTKMLAKVLPLSTLLKVIVGIVLFVALFMMGSHIFQDKGEDGLITVPGVVTSVVSEKDGNRIEFMADDGTVYNSVVSIANLGPESDFDFANLVEGAQLTITGTVWEMEGNAQLTARSVTTGGSLIEVGQNGTIDLSGTGWRYVAASLIDVWAEVPEGIEITLNFADGQVDGNAGCNGYFGEYTQDSESLSFGPLGTTRMLCEDDVMFEEDMFLENLALVDSFYYEGNQLTLNYGEGTALIFERQQMIDDEELSTNPENETGQIIDHGGLHTYETCIGTPDSIQLGAPENKQCAIDGKVYFESGQPDIPLAQCTSYYDGCNTSMVNNGELGGTTLMACEEEMDVPACYVGEEQWDTAVGEIIEVKKDSVEIVFGDIVESFMYDDVSLAGLKVGDTVRIEYLWSADYTEKKLTSINEF